MVRLVYLNLNWSFRLEKVEFDCFQQELGVIGG